MTLDTVPNLHSTAEWVDEPYSRRLWQQLLKRSDLAGKTTGCLLTARKHAWHVFPHGKARDWGLIFLLPGPHAGWLDLALLVYRREGQFVTRQVLMRISRHAGERLFERLRTNSAEDLFQTLVQALLRLPHYLIKDFRVHVPADAAPEIQLPWGTLHGVVDAGVWVAKTFIPVKPA